MQIINHKVKHHLLTQACSWSSRDEHYQNVESQYTNANNYTYSYSKSYLE